MYNCREGDRENALHPLRFIERAGILDIYQNSQHARSRAACAAHSPPCANAAALPSDRIYNRNFTAAMPHEGCGSRKRTRTRNALSRPQKDYSRETRL